MTGSGLAGRGVAGVSSSSGVIGSPMAGAAAAAWAARVGGRG